MAAYSQNLWTDFLRDFVLHVVGEKVVVAGNSIGGFLCASMAADHPELVAGLVLLNSAGEPQPPKHQQQCPAVLLLRCDDACTAGRHCCHSSVPIC